MANRKVGEINFCGSISEIELGVTFLGISKCNVKCDPLWAPVVTIALSAW